MYTLEDVDYQEYVGERILFSHSRVMEDCYEAKILEASPSKKRVKLQYLSGSIS